MKIMVSLFVRVFLAITPFPGMYHITAGEGRRCRERRDGDISIIEVVGALELPGQTK